MLAPDVIGARARASRASTSRWSAAARRRTASSTRRRRHARARASGSRRRRSRPRRRGDVGSPNRILREEIGGRVIVRTGRRIPGVVPLGGVHAPISVVRMAVGDAYGAEEWREGEGDDEVAFRTERIERRICRSVAEFAFRLAERTGAKVFGGPKYTVSPVYEGMLKEEMDAAAERHPDVPLRAAADRRDLRAARRRERRRARSSSPRSTATATSSPTSSCRSSGRSPGSESLLVAFDDDYVPDRRDGGGRARHGAVAPGQERREPDGDDPRGGGAALARGRRAAGRRARDPRGLPRGRRRRDPHRRPRRARGDERVHRRGRSAARGRSSRSGRRSSRSTRR